MGSSSIPRMTWAEICRCREYRGRWVALDECRYEDSSEQPCEAHVVDADDDLAELCTRIRNANHRSCAIVFCDEAPVPVHPSTTPPPLSRFRGRAAPRF